jgi:hypothetical protein
MRVRAVQTRGSTRSSVEVLPSVCPVQTADPHGIQDAWLEVPRIDSHVVHFSRSHSYPVHDAPAGCAAHKAQRLRPPGVRVSGARPAANPNIGCLVIRPKNTIAPADRAVAVCERARPTWNFDSNCSTVTAAGEHRIGSPVMPSVRVERRAATDIRPQKPLAGGSARARGWP